MSLKKIKYVNIEDNLLDDDIDASPDSLADIEIRMDNYGYISIKDYGKISEMECTDVFPKNHVKREKKTSYLAGVPNEYNPAGNPSEFKLALAKQTLKKDVDKKLYEISKDFDLIKEHTSSSNTLLDRELSTFLEKLNQAWSMINQFSAAKT